MIRLGLVSFSDGRIRVHESLEPDILEHQRKIQSILESTGEIEVITSEIVFSTNIARDQGIFLRKNSLDGIVFNIPVFAFPNFSVITARLAQCPFFLLGPKDPRYPGLGGLLGASGGLNQVGLRHERLWASLDDPTLPAKLLAFARAAKAATRLKGQVYGLIGGRSIGMYTGAAPAELWQRHFGVDIDHVDQSEIIRRAHSLSENQVKEATEWLKKHVKVIHFDGVQLTPQKLDFEVRCWLALQEIIDEFGFDFVGLKCHFDLSQYFSVQCLAASFINDPYDWRGPKTPVPLACEADSDGALTMQILTLISDLPSTLLDLRFFDVKHNVLVMPNCGAAATWYAARSQDPSENLSKVQIVPSIPKYVGGGAHVQFVFGEGPLTLARLTRSQQGYRMIITKGESIVLPINDVQGTGINWPHAFVQTQVSIDTIIQKMESNHFHAVAGDWCEELKKFCEMLSLDCEVL